MELIKKKEKLINSSARGPSQLKGTTRCSHGALSKCLELKFTAKKPPKTTGISSAVEAIYSI